MHTIIKFRVYCETEAQWVETWTEKETITVCPNNNTHQINDASIQEMTRTTEVEVKIKQESTETGGHFTMENYSMNIQPNETKSMDISWKFPVSVKVIYVIPDLRYPDNTITGIAAPQTIIGAILSDVESGSKTVAVNNTVTENIKIGYECFIGNEFVGRITSVDKALNVISFTDPIQTSKAANSLVRMQISVVKDLPVGHIFSGNTIGANNLSSKYIPKDMKIRCIYTNRYAQEIDFKFCIEYMY
jgi:hypothetical protein